MYLRQLWNFDNWTCILLPVVESPFFPGRTAFLKLGPDSAGVDPVLGCLFRKGWLLTSNDADLSLKHIILEFFPKVFGLNADESLDVEIAREKFHNLTKRTDRDIDGQFPRAEVAYGFVEVASEMMARSIRAVSEARGYAVSKHKMVSFGGAGGQPDVAFLGIRIVLTRWRFIYIIVVWYIFS